RFSQDAVRIIEDVRRRGGRAIVAGGTGFYIRALTGAVELAPQFDEQLRGRLAREARLHDAAFLHEWLSFHDRARAKSLHPQDAYRVLRALEVALGGDAAMQRREPVVSLQSAGIPFVKAFLEIDDATLKHNIEDRTRTMLARGLLEEAERIGPEAIAASAVGYPQADAYLRGWCTEGELQTLLNRATWRYAKRQQTWFRTEPQTIRVPVADARATLARLAREKLGWA
ncbi:MAG: hypothetical protein JOZ38_06605, partial [Candidatus Eremiobacteraeota bacterium]|nr:hypothetical protein [Candidatus Eremiobacteraeota bacterium]